jgi:transposase-like protein
VVTPPDMSTPVTRAELRDELRNHPTNDELREIFAKHPTAEQLREELDRFVTSDEQREQLARQREEMAQHIAALASRHDDDIARTRREAENRTELWGGGLLDRIDRVSTELRTQIAALRTEFRADLERVRREIIAELRLEFAHHVKSFEEFTRSMIIAINEPYRDLPARVTRLENKVFAPKRKRR